MSFPRRRESSALFVLYLRLKLKHHTASPTIKIATKSTMNFQSTSCLLVFLTTFLVVVFTFLAMLLIKLINNMSAYQRSQFCASCQQKTRLACIPPGVGAKIEYGKPKLL